MENQEEIWKPLKYRGQYVGGCLISTSGEIVKILRTGEIRKKKRHIVNGSYCVYIQVKGEPFGVMVHRAMVETFLEAAPSQLIQFKDGDRLNPSLENLDIPPEGSRPCRICKETLPLQSFSISKSNYGGHFAYCKSCDAKRVRERREQSKAATAA